GLVREPRASTSLVGPSVTPARTGTLAVIPPWISRFSPLCSHFGFQAPGNNKNCRAGVPACGVVWIGNRERLPYNYKFESRRNLRPTFRSLDANSNRRVIPSYEAAAGFSEGEMARASIAPDPCPCPDGDVAGRAHLRFAFAVSNRWQRHGPIIILRNHFWPGSRAPGGADWVGRLERDQK